MRHQMVMLFCLYSWPGLAQSWCPPGAMWTFDYADLMAGYFGAVRVEYVGDTLLGGYTAQKLRETEVTTPWGQENYTAVVHEQLFTRYDEGVVYTWQNWSGSYDTLMWFSAVPGDRWHVPGMDEMALVVVDTTTVQVLGVPLRRLVIDTDPPSFPALDTLYERIGFQYLYISGWSWFLLDMPYNGLLCYHDDLIDYVAPGSVDCDFTLDLVDAIGSKPLLLFPNPGDHFTVQLPPGSNTITVHDALGRAVLQLRASEASTTIGTQALPSGLYTVRTEAADGSVQRASWMKE